jgi:hypothetical protein
MPAASGSPLGLITKDLKLGSLGIPKRKMLEQRHMRFNPALGVVLA